MCYSDLGVTSTVVVISFVVGGTTVVSGAVVIADMVDVDRKSVV